ncbi:STAS domain-containing protein [Bacillus sp. V5-8f]|uniref:STAS domain-containing protein n=1 Tax=Bacillus sp. V5-8f TaxID=2053044 RepID=UPI0015E0E8BE|nr:STAS domain-containing protein [Bacillus sp. V5-8f]
MSEDRKNMNNGRHSIYNLEQGSLAYDSEETRIEQLDILLDGFMATIAEINGLEKAESVLEAAGFRTGKILAEKLHITYHLQEIENWLSHIYKISDWGNVEIEHLCLKKKTVILRLAITSTNEISTNLSIFLSAHFAGLFSYLFNENMWYRFSENKQEDHMSSIIEISRSTNSHYPVQPIRTQEEEQIEYLKTLVEEKKNELTNTIRELSSPVIPVLENIVVIPLFGKFEDSVAAELTEKILNGIIKFEAKYLLLDLTAVKELDEFTPAILRNITQAVKLLGAQSFLVGISPAVSLGMVESKIDIRQFKCFNTLKHALTYTLSVEGLQITKSG